ncbi:MAG: glucose-1-phosphate adenylyltransferase [Gammaproteobacteria bacterium]|nr:MAG: glucose-1-phosphate adenylyltransferase [Gammaproteobacteria bacterium]
MDFMQNQRFVSKLTRNTLAVILAGGRGGRLANLTDWRTKPAVPFGGKFRIIDFPLSNCINSGIRQTTVLTQYKAHSLIQHLQRGWGFLRGEFGEFIEIIPAQQRINQTDWYAGTADAVYQNIDIINSHRPDYVLVLAGDHIYKMDYGTMIAKHVQCGADMTVGCIETPIEMAKAFGVMSVNEDGVVSRFTEKPENPEPMPGRDDVALCSMGIYVFSRDFLFEQLRQDAANFSSSRDFAKDIIPYAISSSRVVAHPFRDPNTGKQPYFRDVGTVDAFYEANQELISEKPELDLYDEEWPIWTYQAQLPPAKFIFNEDGRRGMAINSMVSGGDLVSGSIVRDSLLFSHVHVHSHSLIEKSIIMPGVTIGENCKIKNAIIEEACTIPEGTIIGEDLERDSRYFHVSPKGVVLVTPEMMGQEVLNIR